MRILSGPVGRSIALLAGPSVLLGVVVAGMAG
ncbi:hypothetical protein JOF36_007238 [Pseudonocardia parietis]|uniref:Uncharacterized protein n=1 Tax=Pseudonocardia parietis TaxID=570936 RepID=A0ABS4W5H7_9PSEU|nr:hypothetical protein [Pseudonocardia parietis]